MKIHHLRNRAVLMCIGFLSTGCGFYTIDNQSRQSVTIVINGEENKEIPPCECIRLTEKLFGISGDFPFRILGQPEPEYGSGNYKITSDLVQNACNNKGSDTREHLNQQNQGTHSQTLSVAKVDSKCENSKEADETDNTTTSSSMNDKDMTFEKQHAVLCPEGQPGCPENYEAIACFSPKDETWGKPILPFCVNNTENKNGSDKKGKPRCPGNNHRPVCVEKSTEKMRRSTQGHQIVCKFRERNDVVEGYQPKCVKSGAIPNCAWLQNQQGRATPSCLSENGTVLESVQCVRSDNRASDNASVSAFCEAGLSF